MTTLRQRANIDMSNYAPAPARAQETNPQPPEDPTSSRNPMMLAAMPLAASTGDAFQRQFYGGTNIPTTRILPARNGGGA